MNKKTGAIAAGHAVTAAAAQQILDEGGNAFDAAIAGLWAACVAEPILASPAGGGFLMAHDQSGKTGLFDFFVSTPLETIANADFRAITVDFGTATQIFHIGAGAAAVPGYVPGLFAVHEKHGSLPMARLLEPAIYAAKSGVELSPFQAHLAALVEPILVSTPNAAAHFAPLGHFPKVGERLTNLALAQTLDQLAHEGATAFTHGDVAAAMIATCKDGRGCLTGDDLSTYLVKYRRALTVDYGGWDLALNPPPAAGGALVGLTLQLAVNHQMNNGGQMTPAAMARALGEVAAIRGDGSEDIAQRICGDYLTPSGSQAKSRPNATRPNATRGTTHISVVDAAGNAAAATVSNGEGNGEMVGGFLMNNVLGEDDVNPGGFGSWTPGVRPASMMAPTLMRKDGQIVALGSGGSNRIRSAVARVVALIAQGKSLEAAITAPRLHVEGNHLDFEDNFSAAHREALTVAFPDQRAWPEPNMFFGGVHAASRRSGSEMEAFADHRRNGAVSPG